MASLPREVGQTAALRAATVYACFGCTEAQGGRKRNAAEKIAPNIARESNYPQPQVVKPHLMTVKYSMQACCGLVEHCISTCSMTTGKIFRASAYNEKRMRLLALKMSHLGKRLRNRILSCKLGQRSLTLGDFPGNSFEKSQALFKSSIVPDFPQTHK